MWSLSNSIFNAMWGRGRALLVMIGMLAISSATLAVEPPDPEAGKQACKSDVLSHCRIYVFTRDRGKIQACLKEHRQELKPACRDYMTQAEAFQAIMRKHCGADIDRFCAQARGNREAMRSCMRKHKDRFSRSCQDFLKAAFQKKSERDSE
ncbi:MAG: hypothetical protein NXI24_22225 [bacterium]|nr:hypothetical protein [bacterium]